VQCSWGQRLSRVAWHLGRRDQGGSIATRVLVLHGGRTECKVIMGYLALDTGRVHRRMCVARVIRIGWIRLDGLVMGVLGMQCSDRVSAHVEVKVVWSAHGGSAVVDGGDGDWGGKLRVLAIKGVVAVAGAAVVAVVVLGVAMGVVVVVVVFYLHLVGVVVVWVVGASFGDVVWVVVEQVALCGLGIGVVATMSGFICGMIGDERASRREEGKR
jgi:hypothetical protein